MTTLGNGGEALKTDRPERILTFTPFGHAEVSSSSTAAQTQEPVVEIDAEDDVPEQPLLSDGTRPRTPRDWIPRKKDTLAARSPENVIGWGYRALGMLRGGSDDPTPISAAPRALAIEAQTQAAPEVSELPDEMIADHAAAMTADEEDMHDEAALEAELAYEGMVELLGLEDPQQRDPATGKVVMEAYPVLRLRDRLPRLDVARWTESARRRRQRLSNIAGQTAAEAAVGGALAYHSVTRPVGQGYRVVSRSTLQLANWGLKTGRRGADWANSIDSAADARLETWLAKGQTWLGERRGAKEWWAEHRQRLSVMIGQTALDAALAGSLARRNVTRAMSQTYRTTSRHTLQFTDWGFKTGRLATERVNYMDSVADARLQAWVTSVEAWLQTHRPVKLPWVKEERSSWVSEFKKLVRKLDVKPWTEWRAVIAGGNLAVRAIVVSERASNKVHTGFQSMLDRMYQTKVPKFLLAKPSSGGSTTHEELAAAAERETKIRRLGAVALTRTVTSGGERTKNYRRATLVAAAAIALVALTQNAPSGEHSPHLGERNLATQAHSPDARVLPFVALSPQAEHPTAVSAHPNSAHPAPKPAGVHHHHVAANAGEHHTRDQGRHNHHKLVSHRHHPTHHERGAVAHHHKPALHHLRRHHKVVRRYRHETTANHKRHQTHRLHTRPKHHRAPAHHEAPAHHRESKHPGTQPVHHHPRRHVMNDQYESLPAVQPVRANPKLGSGLTQLLTRYHSPLLVSVPSLPGQLAAIQEHQRQLLQIGLDEVSKTAKPKRYPLVRK